MFRPRWSVTQFPGGGAAAEEGKAAIERRNVCFGRALGRLDRRLRPTLPICAGDTLNRAAQRDHVAARPCQAGAPPAAAKRSPPSSGRRTFHTLRSALCAVAWLRTAYDRVVDTQACFRCGTDLPRCWVCQKRPWWTSSAPAPAAMATTGRTMPRPDARRRASVPVDRSSSSNEHY